MTLVGVDIGGTKCEILVERGGRVLRRLVQTGRDTDPQTLVDAVVDTLEGDRAAGIGVAIPGVVDAAGRVIACDVLPRLEGWEPAAALSRWGDRVFADNDANVALAGELVGMQSVPSCTVLFVVGTGVGMAIAFGPKVWRGSFGLAGEPGSVAVRDGLLDEVAGGAAILRDLGLSAIEVRAGLVAGDPQVLDRVARSARAVAGAAATTIQLLDPEVILIAGGVADYPGYLEHLSAALDAQLPPLFHRPGRLRRPRISAGPVAHAALSLARGLQL